jgi:hypothetical protein
MIADALRLEIDRHGCGAAGRLAHADVAALVAGHAPFAAYGAAVFEEDPVLYMSCVLAAEHFRAMSGEGPDLERVEHVLDTIDMVVDDPCKLARMRQVLLESLAALDRICIQIAGTKDQDAPWDSRAPFDQASAT